MAVQTVKRLPLALPAPHQKVINPMPDVLGRIFSTFSYKEVSSFRHVSRGWKTAVDMLHQNGRMYPHNIAAQFSRVVNKLPWADVYRYAPLAEIVETIQVKWARAKVRDNINYVKIPQPYAISGDYFCEITPSSDILIKKDENQKFYFKNSSKNHFIALAIEGADLFALRDDGKVLRFHPMENPEQSEINVTPNPHTLQSFQVKHEHMFIEYGDHLEVISLTSLQKMEYLIPPGYSDLIIFKNKIYISHYKTIHVFDYIKQEKHEINFDNDYSIQQLALDENILYLFLNQDIGWWKWKIRRINLKTLYQESISAPSLHNFELRNEKFVFGNLLMLASDDEVRVHDLKREGAFLFTLNSIMLGLSSSLFHLKAALQPFPAKKPPETCSIM